jgi:integrase
VLGEEDDLKTDGSVRDIQMTQLVYEALKAQHALLTGGNFRSMCSANQAGNPIDNKNFINRVWAPLLRQSGAGPPQGLSDAAHGGHAVAGIG